MTPRRSLYYAVRPEGTRFWFEAENHLLAQDHLDHVIRDMGGRFSKPVWVRRLTSNEYWAEGREEHRLNSETPSPAPSPTDRAVARHLHGAREALDQLIEEATEARELLRAGADQELSTPGIYMPGWTPNAKFPRAGMNGSFHLLDPAARAERELTAALTLLSGR